MKSGKRFFDYWRENIKTAKEHHEFTILIIWIIWQFIFVGLFIAGQKEASYQIPHLEEIERVSIYLFALAALLWLPFQRNETVAKKHSEEITISSNRLADLQKQLDTNARYRETKNQLGVFVKELDQRTSRIGAMNQNDYGRTLSTIEKSVNGLLLDEFNMNGILFIYLYIKENIGAAEAELFNSVTELGVNEALEKQMHAAPNMVERTRIYTIARLQLHTKQLKEIIVSYK